MTMLLNQAFYNRPTLKVAQDLLGCFLVRKLDGKMIKTMIVETEGYCGPQDLASHASRGRTERNKVMFGPPGFFYVYFTYGMHYMLNIVTEKGGYPAAVLIRAVEPKTLNLRDISKKQGIQNEQKKANNSVSNGPAKLTKFLQIDKSFNGMPCFVKIHGLWIEGRSNLAIKNKIVRSTRIGVDYAGEFKNKKWRFYLKDNIYISRK